MSVDHVTDELHLTAEAREHRLARRVAALERQIEARIAQVEDYQRRLAHAENGWKRAEDERKDGEQAAAGAAAVLWKAEEYDKLMGTVTMKALRLPRAWYGQARRRLLDFRPRGR